jgi:hypothetical protein
VSITGGALASRALATVIAAVIIAPAVAACNGAYLAPDPATCKAALQAEYLKAAAGQGRFETAPAACKGLPKAQVRRFVLQITAGR